MAVADLRALAERLGMLKPCDCATGCERCDFERDGGDYRLPTEAEVREAIFEAGATWLEVGAVATFAGVEVKWPPARRTRGFNARSSEAAPNDLVLLALLRALEGCRG